MAGSPKVRVHARRVSRAALVLVLFVAALMVLFVPLTPSHGSHGTTPAPRATPTKLPQAVDPQFAPTVLAAPDPSPVGEFGSSVAVTSSYVIVGAPGESPFSIDGAGIVYIENPSTGVTTEVANPSPQLDAHFGFSVAASGNYVVVGAPGETLSGALYAGAVYLFNTSGALLHTYTSPNAGSYGQFGYSVAIGGGYIVVGAPYENQTLAPVYSGNVYLIDIQTGATRLVFSPVPQNDGLFGFSVSISGDLVAVGAVAEISGGLLVSGNAYVVSLATADVIASIANPAPAFEGYFGWSVALNGTTLVVGAPGAGLTNMAGTAYEFNLDTGAVTAFASPSPTADGSFGIAVAVDGTTILVGAADETSGGVFQSGNAYLFSETSGALVSSAFNAPEWPWDARFGAAVAEIGGTVVVGAFGANASGYDQAGLAYIFDQIPLTVTSPGATFEGGSGYSVAISGGVAVVGAPFEFGPGDVGFAGNAYVVSVDASGGPTVLTLTSPTDEVGDFGAAVAISGNLVVVGAPGIDSSAGQAYVFSATTGALLWTLSSPNAVLGGSFGLSVAISGNLVVVGAPEENSAIGSVAVAGNAYVFNASTGALVSTLGSATPTVGGSFGDSVAIGGGVALVGAPGETSGGQQLAGNAYLFDPTTGALIATLTSPTPQSGGEFGFAVAVAGGTAVVGAPFQNAAGELEAGAAYTFSATTGALGLSLDSPNAQLDGYFGSAVATNGITVVVGAPNEVAVDRAGAGSIYVFDATTGAPMDRFYSPNAVTEGEFGSSVGEDLSRIVVGAPYENTAEVGDAGESYIFGLETTPFETPTPSAYDTLLLVYDGRPDLQSSFPNAFSNFSNYEKLLVWAGEVVTGAFHDSALSALAPFGYYYALVLVYESRSDLQAAFPNAITNSVSYEELLDWAKGVVLEDFSDSSYATLLPFAASYEELG